MAVKRIKFSRTEAAAKSERLTKWDLIAAIAEDADEAGIAITGVGSRVAARAALEAAGNELSSATVKQLCVIAKFDWESTTAQRAIWRRYGWTIPYRFAAYGYSQSAAAEFLRAGGKTASEVLEYIGSGTIDRPADPENWSAADWKTFDSKVVEASRLLIRAGHLQDKGYYIPSVAAAAMLSILNPGDLDDEFRKMLEQDRR